MAKRKAALKPFRLTIMVKNDEEGMLVMRGLTDPEVMALVKVMGALSKLPTKKMKMLVLELVQEAFATRTKLS